MKKALTDLIVEGFLEHIPHRRGTFVSLHKGRAGAIQFIDVAIDDVRNFEIGRAGEFACLYALNDGLLRAGISALSEQVDHAESTEIPFRAAGRAGSRMQAHRPFPMVLGHRGFPARYPENTLLSFRKALEAGADGIECDMQKTADGRYVVIHDDTVERTSDGEGSVGALSYDELRRFDFGCGERLPALEEMLAAVPGGKYLDLELKSETLSVDDCAPISEVLARGIDRRRLMISSFEPALLLPFRRNGYTVGLLLGEEAYTRGASSLAGLLLSLRPQFLNLPVQTMERIGARRTRLLLRFLRFLGISVLWWTVNDLKAVADVIDGARIIITDDVAGILSARGSLRNESGLS